MNILADIYRYLLFKEVMRSDVLKCSLVLAQEHVLHIIHMRQGVACYFPHRFPLPLLEDVQFGLKELHFKNSESKRIIMDKIVFH